MRCAKPGIAVAVLVASTVVPVNQAVAQTSPAEGDVLMRALADELARSMDKLALDDLPRPYFIQYRAEDRVSYTMNAAYGGLTSSDRRHTRSFSSRVRVGSYEMDNTNVGGGYGARASLPLDDDYVAIRHAIWQATDADYTRAIEVFTR